MHEVDQLLKLLYSTMLRAALTMHYRIRKGPLNQKLGYLAKHLQGSRWHADKIVSEVPTSQSC